MKQVAEMDWTDGTGKALRTLAVVIEEREKANHSLDDDYFSNPNLVVMDLISGSTILLQTEPHHGGKTHGNGYRRCSAVEQRIPRKMPMKKVLARLLKMAIRNFVPTDSLPEEYSIVAKSAIKDIAKMVVDDKAWSIEDDKYAAALTAAVSDLMKQTISTRAGDTLLKMEAIPMNTANMDVSKLKPLEEQTLEVNE